MKRTLLWILVATAGSCAVLLFARHAETQAAPQGSTSAFEKQVEQNRAQMFDQGKRIFRYDTFGDEAFGAERYGCIRRLPARRMEG